MAYSRASLKVSFSLLDCIISFCSLTFINVILFTTFSTAPFTASFLRTTYTSSAAASLISHTKCFVLQACLLFHRILTSAQFWIEKCEYDGVTIPSLSWRKFLRQEMETSHDSGEPSGQHEFDYKKIFYRRPFNRNLAVQLSSTSTLNGLKKNGMVFRGGGDG